MEKEKIYKGANIGVITINNIQSNGTKLVGSNIPSNNYVSMTISTGEIKKSEYGTSHHSSKDHIITVEMTHSQWSELISSFGIGGGKLCTIERRDGIDVPQEYVEPNLNSQTKKNIRKKIESLMEEFLEESGEINDILNNKKSINKGDREIIKKKISKMNMELLSNLPFLTEIIEENLEKKTEEATSQFKNNVYHSLVSMGIDEINVEEYIKLMGNNLLESGN